MSFRVTATEVKEIIETTLTDAGVEAYISAANVTITAWLGGNANLTSDQLMEIERWLSAHLIACSERQLRAETAGQAKDEYAGSFGMGLDFTSYGQQVKMLDTTGILAAKVGRRAASLYAIPSFPDSDTE